MKVVKKRHQSHAVKELIADYLVSFFGAIFELNKHARIHGIDHIVNKRYHPLERILWFALVVSTIFSGFYIGKRQMRRFNANPTVISLERDFRDWKGTIPAITFCHHKRIDDVKAKNLIKRFWNVEPTDSEHEHFMDYVNLVVNASIYSLGAFNRYVNDRRLEFVDMVVIARSVIPNINVLLSSDNPNDNPAIVQIMTERGICHTVNGILSTSLLATKDMNNVTMELTKCSSLVTQCFMLLEIFDATVEYFIHSPHELVTANSPFIQARRGEEIEDTYDIVETVASEELKSLTVTQRKCLFYDESISNFVSNYSQNLCKLACKASTAQELCGCRPHFYSFINGTSCSPSGFFCLSMSSWTEEVEQCERKCPKTCSDLVYTQNMFRKSKWAADAKEDFSASNKSLVRYEILQQKIRYRREFLFSFEDLVVSFGGIAALFIGCNLWNISQMLSFIIITAMKYSYRKFLLMNK